MLGEGLESLSEYLAKGEGEGSRGGKVIGHTSSGKPIYETSHSHYKNKLGVSANVDGKHLHGAMPNFHAKDHHEAAAAHKKAADRLSHVAAGTLSEAQMAAKRKMAEHLEAARAHKGAAKHASEALNAKTKEGKLLGHTSSGKPVHAEAHPRSSLYRDWSAKDHEDAWKMHHQQWKDQAKAGEDHLTAKTRTSFHRKMADMKGETKKSGIDELNDFLVKAEQCMPSGTPSLESNPANGESSLAGKGKQSGSGDSGASPPVGAPATKTEKLSEDDAEFGKLPTGKKKLETTAKKSLAHANAALAAQLRKGSPDVKVGVGVAPPPKPAQALQKGQTWQAPGSMVVYGNESDLAAERLLKSDSFYRNNDPTLMPRAGAQLNTSVLCKSCGVGHAAMFSACPACGEGATQYQVLPSYANTALQKASTGPALRPAKSKPDLFLPRGTRQGG